jgi:carbamoyl-phosphate synthase large subunit
LKLKIRFADINIAVLWDVTEREVFNFRKENGVMPVYKMVDTCAAI